MTGSLQVRPKFTRLCALFRSAPTSSTFPFFSRALPLLLLTAAHTLTHTHTTHNLRRNKNKERIKHNFRSMVGQGSKQHNWNQERKTVNLERRALCSVSVNSSITLHTQLFLSGQFKLTNRLKNTLFSNYHHQLLNGWCWVGVSAWVMVVAVVLQLHQCQDQT